MFESIANYKDASALATTCDGLAEKIGLKNTYTQAVSAKKFAKTEEQFQKVAKKFREASDYLDADALAVECEKLAVAAKAQQEEQALEKSAKRKKEIDIYHCGRFCVSDHNFLEQRDVDGWTDTVEIGIRYNNVIGLKADGTTLVVGYGGNGQYSAVESWKDIKLPA